MSGPSVVIPGWEKAQAARCGCRGTDDYCACINEYNPAKYGLQETEKCGECGLLASSLQHRFCTRADCPVRELLAAKDPNSIEEERAG